MKYMLERELWSRLSELREGGKVMKMSLLWEALIECKEGRC